MKKISKDKIITFLIGGIVCSCISVYATTIIAGANITYSNTSSGLASTNVQAALDEINSKTKIGNASASEILNGKVALVGGKTITGTMTNQGAKIQTISPGATYTIPAGYHNGSGKITASAIPSTYKNLSTTTTATAADIAVGKTAYNNSGTLITGTKTTPGATTILSAGTINVASYEAWSNCSVSLTGYANYKNITVDNIQLVGTNMWNTGLGVSIQYRNLSYTASSGALSFQAYVSSKNMGHDYERNGWTVYAVISPAGF